MSNIDDDLQVYICFLLTSTNTYIATHTCSVNFGDKVCVECSHKMENQAVMIRNYSHEVFQFPFMLCSVIDSVVCILCMENTDEYWSYENIAICQECISLCPHEDPLRLKDLIGTRSKALYRGHTQLEMNSNSAQFTAEVDAHVIDLLVDGDGSEIKMIRVSCHDHPLRR